MAALRFLQSPTTSDLAADASIHYITTTTSISEPTAILKHLAAQGKQAEKKEEKVLFTIESPQGCCVETLTTLQFRMGGGAWLPGMDANMLDEREVTFPLTHVFTYNAEGKIQQIRMYWDQGTLLKQVEAIGKTGRNWPIRDGKAQTDAVASSVKAAGQTGNAQVNPTPLGVRSPNEVVIKDHHKRDSVSVTRDPHASLALFAERDPNEGRSYSGPKYEPVKSAKPGPRDYGELFASEETASALGSAARSPSPHKTDGTILKAGAGKHFSGNRIFDEVENEEPAKSPVRKKTYGQKYEHFAFGNGEDAPKENRPISGKGKNQSAATFSFEDFTTPPKHVEKLRRDDERHWGAGVDEDDPVGSPPKRPIVHAARKDAEPHWEMADESPAPSKMKSFQRQKGMGLYQDPLAEDERTSTRNRMNVNNNRRGDDFGPHYSMTDNSPAGGKQQSKASTRSDLAANWGFESPQEKKIYKTAGDGMGNRAGPRAW